MGSSEGLYTKYLYMSKTNTTSVTILNITNGTIHSTLTDADTDIVEIVGLVEDAIVSSGTSMGGKLIN